MNELEQKVAFVIMGETGLNLQVATEAAQAALKAHAEYLEEQGLEIRPAPKPRDHYAEARRACKFSME